MRVNGRMREVDKVQLIVFRVQINPENRHPLVMIGPHRISLTGVITFSCEDDDAVAALFEELGLVMSY